ncbi:hypothetical protein O7635_28990 [Asanoa sp. WMMD1127]|uniref:hypothetical protein n=1 Tax=Asanoa sp. WMMD1127 TaxID=3016107 RepID=UPI0024169B25|nr:hypothetical protein [Asanoa sp. WMMD1127]MDG4825903.1 hypothetical protein [Asanoa sp. WMMD1127]
MTDADTTVDGVDVEQLAAAVEDCPAVDALVEGPPAMAATYLPRRRITGIRIDGDVVTAQVRLRFGSTVGQLARQVWRAATPLAGPRRVDIVVADISEPPTGGAGQ